MPAGSQLGASWAVRARMLEQPGPPGPTGRSSGSPGSRGLVARAARAARLGRLGRSPGPPEPPGPLARDAWAVCLSRLGSSPGLPEPPGQLARAAWAACLSRLGARDPFGLLLGVTERAESVPGAILSRLYVALLRPGWLNLAAHDSPNDSRNETISQKKRLAYRRSEHRSCCFIVLVSSPPCLESSIYIYIYVYI